MSPTKIKVIGFDLDQTLYPKSPEIDAAIQKYLYEKISELHKVSLAEAKKMFDELYRDGKGLGGTKTMMKIGFEAERAKNLVQEALENADIAKFLRPNPEVIDLLKRLKDKYIIDIITGSNLKNTSIKLAKLEIPTDLFSNIITSDQGSKSDLTLYKIWLSKYPDLKSENFLYVGDRVSSDYEKPKELGIKSILVNQKDTVPEIDCLQLPDLKSITTHF